MSATLAEVQAPPRAQAPDVTLELLSSIAHEFRAPLSTLSASAELLQQADLEGQRHFAEIIQRQAQRLNHIVEGLLQSYRAAQGQAAMTRERLDVEDLLVELCAEHEVLFPHHQWRLEAAAGHVVTDRRALAIALTNLMANAAKYAPAGTMVRVSSAWRAGTTVIRVEDEGPGVPELVRHRIFRAGDRGITAGGSGCGLGLFIAQRLCACIGAQLSITETRAGRGACFAISLPDGGGAS
jgi:signal transduction histidine kinase